MSCERSRILELLQEQKEEASRQVENLKQRRKVANSVVKEPTPSPVVEPSTGGLFCLAIFLYSYLEYNFG